VKRWFYIAIEKALRADIEREEAIFALPEDRKLKEDFDRKTVLDLSTPETEYKNLMFPVNQVSTGMLGKTGSAIIGSTKVRLHSGKSFNGSRMRCCSTSRAIKFR